MLSCLLTLTLFHCSVSSFHLTQESPQVSHTHTHTHTCASTVTHTHMRRTHTHAHTHSHTHTCAQRHTHTYAPQSHTHTCAQSHTHTYAPQSHTHILKQTHTYTQVHTYTQAHTYPNRHTHLHTGTTTACSILTHMDTRGGRYGQNLLSRYLSFISRLRYISLFIIRRVTRFEFLKKRTLHRWRNVIGYTV